MAHQRASIAYTPVKSSRQPAQKKPQFPKQQADVVPRTAQDRVQCVTQRALQRIPARAQVEIGRQLDRLPEQAKAQDLLHRAGRILTQKTKS